MRDPEFGPVRVRAFGTYAMRVDDPGTFIKEIVGTDGHFTTEDVTDQVRNILVARFSDAMASSGIPVLDMAANYDELGQKLAGRVHDDMEGYGIELRTLLVENISLPPAVEEALDKRTVDGRDRGPRQVHEVPDRRGDRRHGEQPRRPGSRRPREWVPEWASRWGTRWRRP